jgi:predicted phosphodiesterase
MLAAMRVAALYDVEGHLPALEAVLADVEREQPDAIVFGGDLATGPMPSETLDRMRGLEHALFLRGNADRAVVEVKRGERPAGLPDEAVEALAWTAERLRDEQVAFLAELPQTITIDVDRQGTVCFCHATPRDDNELFTELTPEDAVAELLAGTIETTVVCGHTHMQFDRRVRDWRVINAGSVGVPWDDGPDPRWALLGPDVSLRRTRLDRELAAERIRSTGWPGAEDFLGDTRGRAEILGLFEQAATRLRAG